MGKSCAPAPSKKKEYIADIGKILVKENGKKKYYSPEEVKKAHRRSRWFDVLDFSCWAMSIFSSHSDFDRYHEQTGEICHYVEMKTEMLSAFGSTKLEWADIPDLDIAGSWLDFGEIFGGVLEGIGDVIGGILDGI